MAKKSYNELPPGEIQSTDVFAFNDGVPTTLQDTYTDIEDLTYHTGVRAGLQMTINGGDNTLFDIAAGTAIIVNRNPDPRVSNVNRIVRIAESAILDLFLTSLFTFVFLDSAGLIVQRDTAPPSTLADISDLVFLGQLRHGGGGGAITLVDDNPIMAHGSSSSHIAELVLAGGVRFSGAEVSPASTDLTVDISAGILEQFGRGAVQSQNNPNEFTSPAQVPILAASFFKLFVDSMGNVVADNTTNLLDPTLFNEDGLGVLNTVQANNFTAIRVFVAAGTNAVIFYYGTKEFGSAIDAINAVEPTFVEHPNTIQISPVAKIGIKENVLNFTAAVASGDAIIQPVLRRV